MPQHSCFYRQKISLPLFGMWGAWGCPSSHRHCLCSNSAARAMTFLIAERSDSRGMHLHLYEMCIVEKIPLSQSWFWASSALSCCVFHCTYLRPSSHGQKMTVLERKVSEVELQPSAKLFFIIFGGIICTFICSLLLISGNRRKLGWVLGKEGVAQVPQGCREPSLLFIETFNFFLRSKVLTLNCQVVYNTEPV